MSIDNIPKYDEKLKRLLAALDTLGLGQRGRGAKVASATGYSANQVSWMLSGKTPLNDRFLKLVSQFYHISEIWLKLGEGEMLMVAEPIEAYHATKIIEGITPKEKALLDMVHGDEELLSEVIKYTEEKKLLKELLEEKLRKNTL